jgi:hypothetical protein
MRKVFILIFVFVVSAISAQEIDYKKYIQKGKWFPGFNVTSKKIVYYKKPPGKSNEETVEFRPDGKIIHCAEETENSINASGKKTFVTRFVCDSNQTYEIKNKMMQIRMLQEMPNFYKILVKGETFELTPVTSEAENDQ